MNIVKKLVVKWITKKLFTHSFKNALVNKINAKVDIPKLDEAAERQIFLAVYDVVVGFLKGVIK